MTKAITYQPGFKVAAFATALAMVVVILGAFTRLSDAGLGCPDWPGCYGHILWPNETHEIEQAQLSFPDAYPVDQSKTWPEMVHRYLAGSLGLVVFFLVVLALKNRHSPTYPMRLPLFMGLLIVWQAMFGMWTVTLKLQPQIVSIHLLGGITTLTLLALLTMRLSPWRWQLDVDSANGIKPLKAYLWAGFALVIGQIFLGGWVASNYAALACVELPTCLNGQWFPNADYAAGFNFLQKAGPNYEGGLLSQEARVAIHLAHRIGAMLVLTYLLWLGLRLWQVGFKPLRNMVVVMLSILFVQVLLGISNVYFVLPIGIAVAHNFVGALLIGSIVIILGQLSFQSAGQSKYLSGKKR